jgi:hypothetical protein
MPTDPTARRRQAEAAAAVVPDSAFFPFDRGAVLQNDLLRLCDRWPAAPRVPGFGRGPLPDVPVLILDGEDDLRTPVENARRVAALFPQSKLVVAPATGHSVLGQSECADRAFASFFRNRPVSTRCHGGRRGLHVVPPPPRRLSAVRRADGVRGVRGRTVRALALTLGDVGADSLTQFIVDPSDPDLVRGGGLRGGRYRIDGRGTLHLRGVVYVPGVRVSGTIRRFEGRRARGRLSISGAAAPHGRLTLRRQRLRGRLGGVRVSSTLSQPAGRVTASAASTRGPVAH